MKRSWRGRGGSGENRDRHVRWGGVGGIVALAAPRLLRRHQLPQEISTAVEAAPRQSPDDLIVNRATAFARVMTVPIIEALRTKDTRHLPGQIAEIAETAGLGEIERGDLVRRCVTAAAEMDRAAHGTRE